MKKIIPMDSQYEEYLYDESKYKGFAESISFPETTEELKEILAELRKRDIMLTVQGGKTGIAAGAVPEGGHILNLSRMKQVKSFRWEEDKNARITVEAGISLEELSKEVANRSKGHPVFWPVEPTEKTASIGGILATGAQGISRLLYGDSRDYFISAKVMDYSGKERLVSRDEITPLPDAVPGDGSNTVFSRDEITQLPDTTRGDGLDAVFAEEGTTGIITEVTLRLIPKPESCWGIAFFFNETKDAAGWIDELKAALPRAENGAVAAVEYIDQTCLRMVQERKPFMTKIKELPDIPPDKKAMVYIELHGMEEGLEVLAEALMESATLYGSDGSEAWAVSGEVEVERLRAFRHAVPETVNVFIEQAHRRDERITKLGMDMIFGDQPFLTLLHTYENGLKERELCGCIFGHALENHLHTNLLPENHEEYLRGLELARHWAGKAENSGGQIIGEHGAGKLKKRIFGDLLSAESSRSGRKWREKMKREEKINKGNRE